MIDFGYKYDTILFDLLVPNCIIFLGKDSDSRFDVEYEDLKRFAEGDFSIWLYRVGNTINTFSKEDPLSCNTFRILISPSFKMLSSVLMLMTMVAVRAFAPTSTNTAIRSSSTLRMANFDTEIGAQAPLGFWDPIGLLVDADQARFDRLRYVETKHGRIAMLAILGRYGYKYTFKDMYK
jgi:hypothetical protein